uniref:EGF-like domain-containing protein n=2 Tax=Cyprinus carpio TaxID=7962 RepID=A0A9J7Y9Z0_CYPCA
MRFNRTSTRAPGRTQRSYFSNYARLLWRRLSLNIHKPIATERFPYYVTRTLLMFMSQIVRLPVEAGISYAIFMNQTFAIVPFFIFPSSAHRRICWVYDLNFVESGGLKHVTLMSPSRMFFLSAVLCVALFHLISCQNCSEHCKTCGGPEKDQCLQCHTGYILHDNLCVDIDECGTDQERCPDNTYCFNTHGSYECKGCDKACVGCMGGGPARCRKCAAGYRSSGMRCIDIDECAEEVLACPGVSMFCENTEGSFHCQCAVGYTRRGDSCERSQTTASEEKGLFDDIQEDEIEVLQQMFFGVVLCALATLAAKGDLVFTSIFMGAVAAMAGYWLSDKSDRVIDSILKGR